MIIDKDIDVKITGYNLRVYIKDYPKIKKGDKIKVRQLDLSPRSTLKLECKCSNTDCENTYFRQRRDISSERTYCSSRCRGEHLTKLNLIEHKRKILKGFEDRIKNNKSIKYNDIKKDDPTLLHAIDKYYPLHEICKDLGISEEDLVNKFGLTRNVYSRTLSEQEIIERLEYLDSKGRLTTSAMRTEFNDLRLEISIKRIYGSVENCFEKLSFKRDIYSNDILIMMGRKFEELFKDILKDLEIEFEYQKLLPNGCIPDFTLCNNDIIIDTKLSSWTTSISDDVSNYTDYCNKLIIVYLREGSTLPKYNKTELISVYYYINKLPLNKKDYYINKLEKILSYHP